MATVSVEDVSGERLRLKVTDAALGISPEKMARLFTPFDRLGAEENGVDGTGLQGGPGLELAKELWLASPIHVSSSRDEAGGVGENRAVQS